MVPFETDVRVGAVTSIGGSSSSSLAGCDLLFAHGGRLLVLVKQGGDGQQREVVSDQVHLVYGILDRDVVNLTELFQRKTLLGRRDRGGRDRRDEQSNGNLHDGR